MTLSRMTFDLKSYHNVNDPMVHIRSKFDYNKGELVQTEGISKRLPETLMDAQTDGHTDIIWIAMHSIRQYKKYKIMING